MTTKNDIIKAIPDYSKTYKYYENVIAILKYWSVQT